MSTQSYTTTTAPPPEAPPSVSKMGVQVNGSHGNALREQPARFDDSYRSSAAAQSFRPDAIPAHFAPTAIRLVLTAAGLGALIGVAASISVPYLIRALVSASSSDVEATPTSTPFYLLPQPYMYLLAWASFHLLEFLVTAKWNSSQLLKDCECTDIEV